MSNINIGERLSFYQLIKNKGYQIEIPIIQRDYAQGRAEEIDIREDFIAALIKYLDENLPNRDLDFVYGSLSENNFIPLDGQQRLTTLFLLHWYIAIKEKRFEEFKQWILVVVNSNHSNSKFTYKTRTSSKEFCDVLVETKVDLTNLLSSDFDVNGKDLKNSLSKTIQDNGEYFLSWQNDPTIKSMLNMLDTIHEKFMGSNVYDYYDRLVKITDPIITFLFLNINEYGLTDDLYIKMNSRGIPLTIYENFKAKLLQHIKLKLKFTDHKAIVINEKEKQVSIPEYFSHKIDTSWTNLFWAYTKNLSDKRVDRKIMNFLRFCFASQYASSNSKDRNIEFLLKTNVAVEYADYTDDISFNKFLSLECITEKSINLIIDSLDNIENGYNRIRQLISDDFKFYFNENEIFESILSYKITLTQRIQFYSYIKFLIINNKNVLGIDDWMRVVHNLTENRQIDGSDDYIKGIKEIDKLVIHSKNINEYLRKNIDIDFFFSRQIQEERIKSFLFEKEGWKLPIIEIEKHPYFKGQILFLFEFSGVLKYFEDNANLNWSENENLLFLNAFIDYSQNVSSVFNDDPNTIQDYLWLRAVLSKGNYLIDVSKNRLNFLSTSRNMRDFSWKRLLRLPAVTDFDRDKWNTKRNFIKAVFDDSDFNKNSIVDSLTKICNKYISNDFKNIFIQNPDLFKYCGHGFIRFNSDDDILLYKEYQSNHKHVELYSYLLYLKSIKEKDFLPFTRNFPWEVKGVNEKSCAVIDEWFYEPNHANYAIDVRYLFNGNYGIRFFDRNLPQTYCQNILNILAMHNFKKVDIYNDDSYIITASENDLLTIISNICISFNKLP